MKRSLSDHPTASSSSSKKHRSGSNEGEKRQFESHTALLLPSCGKCIVLEGRIVVLENDMKDLREELRVIQKELHVIQEELRSMKTSALLRQVALDVERGLKISIIECTPALVPSYYDQRRRFWRDNKLGQVTVLDLWDDASDTTRRAVVRKVGVSFDEDILLELQRSDLFSLKEGVNTIAHPKSQPNGNVVDNAFRLTLLDACPDDVLPNKTLLKELVSRLLT